MKSYTLVIQKVNGKIEKIEYAESRLTDLCMKTMQINDAGTPWYVIDNDAPKKMWRYGNLDKVPPKVSEPETPATEAGVAASQEEPVEEWADPAEDVYPNYMDDPIEEMDLSIPGIADDHIAGEISDEELERAYSYCIENHIDPDYADLIAVPASYGRDKQLKFEADGSMSEVDAQPAKHPLLTVPEDEMIRMLRKAGFLAKHDEIAVHDTPYGNNGIKVTRGPECVTIQRWACDETHSIADAISIYPIYGKTLDVDDLDSYES